MGNSCGALFGAEENRKDECVRCFLCFKNKNALIIFSIQIPLVPSLLSKERNEQSLISNFSRPCVVVSEGGSCRLQLVAFLPPLLLPPRHASAAYSLPRPQSLHLVRGPLAQLQLAVLERQILSRDDSHHRPGTGRSHIQVAQPHLLKQPVGFCHVGVGGDDAGVELHEGPQVHAALRVLLGERLDDLVLGSGIPLYGKIFHVLHQAQHILVVVAKVILRLPLPHEAYALVQHVQQLGPEDITHHISCREAPLVPRAVAEHVHLLLKHREGAVLAGLEHLHHLAHGGHGRQAHQIGRHDLLHVQLLRDHLLLVRDLVLGKVGHPLEGDVRVVKARSRPVPHGLGKEDGDHQRDRQLQCPAGLEHEDRDAQGHPGRSRLQARRPDHGVCRKTYVACRRRGPGLAQEEHRQLGTEPSVGGSARKEGDHGSSSDRAAVGENEEDVDEEHVSGHGPRGELVLLVHGLPQVQDLLQGHASGLEKDSPKGAVAPGIAPELVEVLVLVRARAVQGQPLLSHRVLLYVLGEGLAGGKVAHQDRHRGGHDPQEERLDGSLPGIGCREEPATQPVHPHVQVHEEAPRETCQATHEGEAYNLPPRVPVHLRVPRRGVVVEGKGPGVLRGVKVVDAQGVPLVEQGQDLVDEDPRARGQEALPEHLGGPQVEAAAILVRDQHPAYGRREDSGRPRRDAYGDEAPVGELGLEVHVPLVELELEAV
mmetsp:Transcript_12968/g.24553  ORF Transcript_12968/g.24553 Transcript_12968/m.24553 type:complete len:711 (-) Transcript_12968:1350-3482(-)